MKEFSFDDFVGNMKHYRKQKNWSQSELSIQADISIGQIGNIESGKSKPSFENILKLAKAFKIHPADLFLRDASNQKDLDTLYKYSPIIHKLSSLPQDKQDTATRIFSDICESYSK